MWRAKNAPYGDRRWTSVDEAFTRWEERASKQVKGLFFVNWAIDAPSNPCGQRHAGVLLHDARPGALNWWFEPLDETTMPFTSRTPYPRTLFALCNRLGAEELYITRGSQTSFVQDQNCMSRSLRFAYNVLSTNTRPQKGVHDNGTRQVPVVESWV